jgi:uncharacterized RDD family membrane protein YckC
MRWRDVKKSGGKLKKPKILKKDDINYAPIPTKIKAFLVDMFMIMMPTAYIITYVIMNGKNDMQHSLIARTSLGVIFGIIMISFWTAKAQSPGYRAYNLLLVDTKTLKKPSIAKAILRYIAFIVSSTIIIGELMAFFRKDKKTLHDLLSGTFAITK